MMFSEHIPITRVDEWRILQPSLLPWLRLVWGCCANKLKLRISVVHSSSASWTSPQRGYPDTGGEQGATHGRTGATPLSVSQGFHAVCTDKRLFLAVSLIRGAKDIVNSSLSLQRQRSAAGKAVGAPRAWSLPLPTPPDFLLMSRQQRASPCAAQHRAAREGKRWAKKLFIQTSFNVEPGGLSRPVQKPLLARQAGALGHPARSVPWLPTASRVRPRSQPPLPKRGRERNASVTQLSRRSVLQPVPTNSPPP